MYGKSNMETYNTICKMDSQWNFAVWLRKLKQGLCINLEGWDGAGDGREFQKGGDICIPMADSCWGLTENNKILQSNYPSIKKINKLEKYWYSYPHFKENREETAWSALRQVNSPAGISNFKSSVTCPIPCFHIPQKWSSPLYPIPFWVHNTIIWRKLLKDSYQKHIKFYYTQLLQNI